MLASNVWAWWVQAALIAASGLLLPRLLRATQARVYLPYLQFLLVVSLLLPALLPWNEPEPRTEPVNTAVFVPLPKSSSPQPVQPTPLSPEKAVFWAICAGMAARLTWLGLGLARLDLYRRTSWRIADLPEVLRNALAEVRAHAEFYYANPLAGPVTFGFFRPLVLLPFSFIQMPVEAQRAVAVHELLHVRRNDWLAGLIEELLVAAFWFHPAVWLIVSEIRLAREQAVDRAAVELLGDRAGYAQTLLAMSGTAPPPDCALAGPFLGRGHLFKRIHSLLKENSMPVHRTVFAYGVVVAVVAGTAIAGGQLAPLQAPPEQPSGFPSVTITPTGTMTHHAALEYPEDARLSNVEGTVIVETTADASGIVTGARAIAGPELLRAAAERSALQYMYRSKRPESGRVAIEFRLPRIPEVAMNQQITGIKVQGIPAAEEAAEEEKLSSFVGQTLTPQVWTEIRRASTGHLQIELNDGQGRIHTGPVPRPASGKLASVLLATPIAEPARSELASRLERYVGREIDTNLMQDMYRDVKLISPELTVWFHDKFAIVKGEPIPASDAPDSRIRVGGAVQTAKLVHAPQPQYPPEAVPHRIQGVVRFDATIDGFGNVSQLTQKSGHPMFVRSAMEAVRQWRYHATLLNGKPVEVRTVIDVNFSLP